MEHHFLAYLYRLKYIKRWSLMRSMTEESVAEHSYHVSLLAHLLGTIGNVVYGRSLPVERLVTLALFHDATEVFTGDIPTPVKHQNPELLANFRQIEARAADRLIQMIPPMLQDTYRPLVAGKAAAGQADEELFVYLKAADLLDALLKCTVEVSAGNREFVMAQKQIGQALEKLGLPEVDYVLTHLAPSMEKSLDELLESDESRANTADTD